MQKPYGMKQKFMEMFPTAFIYYEGSDEYGTSNCKIIN